MSLRIRGTVFLSGLSFILSFFFVSCFCSAGEAGTFPTTMQGAAGSFMLANGASGTSNVQSVAPSCKAKAKPVNNAASGKKSKSKKSSSKKQKKAPVGQKKQKSLAKKPKAKKTTVGSRASRTVKSRKRAVKPYVASTSILVVGDSLAVGIGMFLESAFEGVCAVRVKPMGKVSTGLDSPAFYDWQRVLKNVLRSEQFDLVIIMMGANDANNSTGSPDWSRSYESKFIDLLKIPVNKRITTLIVGLPPMRDPCFCERARIANDAIRNASALFPETCVYLDSFTRFADAHGNFTEMIDVNGELKKARARDGVHFTGTGYLLLSKMVVNAAIHSLSSSQGTEYPRRKVEGLN